MRVIRPAVAGIFLLLGSLACEKRDAQSAAATQQSIQVAQFADVLVYLPLYIAIDEGTFRAHGLDVHLVNTGGDDKTFAAVISGAAQFGIADPTFAAVASERGQDGAVVASIVNGVPFWGVTKKPRVPLIDDPEKLKGFTVATFPSPSTAFALQTRMFKQGGLAPAIRQGAFGSLLAMLDAGAADIALELEPNVSTALSQGARIVYEMPKLYGDFATTGVTTSASFAQHDSDAVLRFVAAIDQAERAAHSDPEMAVRVAQRRFSSIAPEIVANATRRMIASGIVPSGARVSEDGWRKALELRREAGDLRSVDSAIRVLDNRFAIRAHAGTAAAGVAP